MGIKQTIKKICPKYVWNGLRKIKYVCNKITGRHVRLTSLGKLNPDKTFYLINTHASYWGVLSTYMNLLPFVDAALEHGWIPVVDLKNCSAPMLKDDDERNKTNAWDLYFAQPQTVYSLESVYKSKNVIFSKWTDCTYSLIEKISIQNGDIPLTDDDFFFWRKMTNLCPLKNEIIEYAEELKKKYFPENKKILGVSYRRCYEYCHFYDLEITPPGTHVVRVTLGSIVDKINEKLDEYGYKYFFFTVDDREAMEKVREHFGFRCIAIDRPLLHYFENGIPVPNDDISTKTKELRETSVQKRTFEYLAEVYLLSKCDSLLSMGGTADFFAYIYNNKQYEHVIQLKTSNEEVSNEIKANCQKNLSINNMECAPESKVAIRKNRGGGYWEGSLARQVKSA